MFRVQGLGCRVWGLGFRVSGSGFRVPGFGFDHEVLGNAPCALTTSEVPTLPPNPRDAEGVRFRVQN